MSTAVFSHIYSISHSATCVYLMRTGKKEAWRQNKGILWWKFSRAVAALQRKSPQMSQHCWDKTSGRLSAPFRPSGIFQLLEQQIRCPRLTFLFIFNALDPKVSSMFLQRDKRTKRYLFLCCFQEGKITTFFLGSKSNLKLDANFYFEEILEHFIFPMVEV